MSNAWETTDDDIRTVLAKHGKNNDATLDVSSSIIVEEGARIEKAALRYTDTDDQTSSALDEIETILIENEILTNPKQFAAP